MLISIREKTQGLVAGFIVMVIILVFALWGVNSYFAGDSEKIVAKGSDIKISHRTYRNAYDNVVAKQRGRIPQSVLDSQFYKQQIVEKLIQETLLTKYVHESGYRISDKDLGERIRQQTYFQKENLFNPELYKIALRSSQLSPNQYEAQLRGDLMAAQLTSGYIKSSFAIDSEINQLLQLGLQERDIEYIEIKPEKFNQSIVVKKKNILAYYEKNKLNYQTTEKIKIQYVTLSVKELAKDYKPTTAELTEAYETGTGLVKPARRWASHILVEVAKGASKEIEAEALKKAEKLANDIKNGKRFAGMAKKYSDDKGSAVQGGDLGEVGNGVMVKEFEAALNEMTKLGAISKPVRTQYGYHLIKLTKYIPEKRKPFKEVKAQLEETVRRQVGEKKFVDASPDFYNIVYEQPDSLKPVADALGLKIVQSAWFSRQGGKDIAANQKIVTAAYHPDVLETGRNSDAIEIDDTTLVAVRLLEYKKQQQRPVSEVEDEIKNRLKHQLALDKVAELKQKVLSDLKNKNDLKFIAKKYKLNLKTGKRLVRNISKDVDKRIIDQVFSMKIPKDGKMVTGEVNLGGQGVAVIALKAVRAGDANKADKAMRARAQELLYKRHGEGYFQAFIEDLRKQTKVKVLTNNL